MSHCANSARCVGWLADAIYFHSTRNPLPSNGIHKFRFHSTSRDVASQSQFRNIVPVSPKVRRGFPRLKRPHAYSSTSQLIKRDSAPSAKGSQRLVLTHPEFRKSPGKSSHRKRGGFGKEDAAYPRLPGSAFEAMDGVEGYHTLHALLEDSGKFLGAEEQISSVNEFHDFASLDEPYEENEEQVSSAVGQKGELVINKRPIDVNRLIKYEEVIKRVQNQIKKNFGGQYRVRCFGGVKYGIFSSDSDLDLVILDPERPEGFSKKAPKHLPQIYMLRSVRKALKCPRFQIKEVISSASVPIVKFVDIRTGIHCDINTNERLGLLNSELMANYCSAFPLLRPLMMSIKQWAKPLGLNQSASIKGVKVTFNTYSLMMMTIGFLQMKGHLPNIQVKKPHNKPSRRRGFWTRKPKQCWDTTVRPEILHEWEPPKDINVGLLLQEWFRFWGSEFDYTTQAVSIRHGGVVKRNQLFEGDNIANKDARRQQLAALHSPFCVMDPFIITKCVAVSASKDVVERFKSECWKASLLPVRILPENIVVPSLALPTK